MLPPTLGQIKSTKAKVAKRQNHSTASGKRVLSVRTAGGLTAKDIKRNKRGKYVSIKRSTLAKKRFNNGTSGIKAMTRQQFLTNVRSKCQRCKKYDKPKGKSSNDKPKGKGKKPLSRKSPRLSRK